jgi:ABC-2 type transport system permease protein
MSEPYTAREASPIADMSYRTYTGPLSVRRMRWWIVALSGLRSSVKKKGFWVVAGISLLPYLMITAQLYFTSRAQAMTGAVGARAAASPMNPLGVPEVGQRFASSFLQAMQFQMFFLFLIALMTGAGVVAADHRANALIVYLSKPITKFDYLFGKWMSVFLMIFFVSLAPALLLYLYCLGSYTSEGFLRDEPLLLLRGVAACCIPAAVHASLLLGFSSWSRTPRMAGALYAGLYFLSSFVSGAVWAIKYRGNLSQGILERHLSVEGVINGIVQNIYGVVQKVATFNRRSGGMEQLSLSPPDIRILLLVGLVLCAVSLFAAFRRIRAVEVVRG